MLANDLILNCKDRQFITKTSHMPSCFIDDWHSHPWHQIVFPLKGLLQTYSKINSFIIPHNGLLYIPANTRHRSMAVTNTDFIAIYLNPNCDFNYRDELKSCLVTPYLKELILHQLADQHSNTAEKITSSLLRTLRDQIELTDEFHTPILIPRDKRLMAIYKQILKNPDFNITLAQWAIKLGTSERTLSRVCAKEFNQSFSLWRQSIRLVLSLELLEKGIPILEIAMQFGYKSDSAYKTAFRQFFFETPCQYRTDYLSQH